MMKWGNVEQLVKEEVEFETNKWQSLVVMYVVTESLVIGDI